MTPPNTPTPDNSPDKMTATQRVEAYFATAGTAGIGALPDLCRQLGRELDAANEKAERYRLATLKQDAELAATREELKSANEWLKISREGARVGTLWGIKDREALEAELAKLEQELAATREELAKHGHIFGKLGLLASEITGGSDNNSAEKDVDGIRAATKKIASDSTALAALKPVIKYVQNTKHHVPIAVVCNALQAVAEIEKLENWKASQLLVESEWNPQAVGKLLNLPLGSSIRAGIEPAVAKLREENAALRAENKSVTDFNNELARSIAPLRADKERLDWLEATLVSLHRLSTPDMDGTRVTAQLRNKLRDDAGAAGPSYVCVGGPTIRALLDAAREGRQ